MSSLHSFPNLPLADYGCDMHRMDVKEIIRTLLLPSEPGGTRPTQAEVAKELNVGQSTISKWLKGTQLPDFAQGQRLRAYAIAKGILTQVDSALAEKRTVVIVGGIGLGETIEWYPQGEGVSLELVELPFAVPEGCFALEAKGDSMFPRVKNGEIIVARSNGHSVEDLLNQEVVLRVKDGAYLFKTLRRGQSPKLFHLESHNGPLRENVEVEWAAELWAIVPSRRWVRIGA